MNNSFQLVLAFIVFIAVGLAAAVSVGTGDYFLPIGLGVCSLTLLLIATVGKHLPLDITIISFGVGGFYIAGKGFAYLSIGNLLFIGEILLAIGLLGYLYRVSKGQIFLVPKSPMAIALILLGSYALLRLPYDFSKYQIMALRDACMIYYTLFFFVAYQAGQSEKVQRLAPLIFITLAVPGMMLDFIAFVAPRVFMAIASFTVNGNPLVLTHYDAIHPAVFGLILALALKGTGRNSFNIFYILLMFAITTYILAMGRGANYIAFSVVSVFLLAARQMKLLVTLFGGVVVLLCALLVLAEINPSIGRNRLKQIGDQLEVIVNPSKIGSGKTQDSDTAEWRLFWWKKIARDVNAANPVFGFGFGADITTEFHQQFFRTTANSPDVARTRGAHNAFFTILARMGWFGAILFLGVVVVQLSYFWRAILAFKNGLIPPTQAYLWGSNICAFVITFFQYAWEAPYSAIPFWTCMGLSYAYLDNLRTQAPIPSARTLAAPTIISATSNEEADSNNVPLSRTT
jgi:O-antigen ligase